MRTFMEVRLGKDLGCFFCILWLGNVRLTVNASQLACHWGGTAPELLLKLVIALKTVFRHLCCSELQAPECPTFREMMGSAALKETSR